MVEHALWEGLATSVGTKVSCETWEQTEQSMFEYKNSNKDGSVR